MQLKFGKITEVDAATGRAKVTFEQDDNLVSDWLPMAVSKTLNDKYSIPYEVNEHVYCIMDHLCETGVIAGAIYDDANTPPDGVGEGVALVKFMASLQVSFNRNTSTLNIQGDGAINININGNAVIKCNKATVESGTDATVKATTKINLTAPIVECSAILKVGSIQTTGGSGLQIDASGNLTTSGKVEASEVKEGAIRLGTHKHIGVQTGGGTSGTPTP